MNTSEKIVPAAIIAISVVIAGLSLRSGIVTFKEMDRKVSVKGLAEREVKADKVTWPLIYKEIGNDPSEMYDRLSSKNKRVIAFLKSAGIKDSDISVNPPVISDRQADNYGNEIMNYRYKATRNARTTAQKFAEDSDSKLGGIRNAQQGQFSIEDRDANTPYIKKVRVVNTVEYSLE